MYYIGIDIGGMSIKGGLVDENGTVYVKKTVVTQADAHYSVIVKDIADLCYSIIAEKGLTINDVQAVGMGIPGTINSQKGVITYSNNINFEKVPIVKEFRKHFDVPTFIGNDANVAALGEARFGAGKNCNDVIVITLGTGIGTGIIVDGKLLEGKVGAGAEGAAGSLCAGAERAVQPDGRLRGRRASILTDCAMKIPVIKEKAHKDLIIQVDGGINNLTAKVCTSLGANSLVAGSYVYGASDIKKAIESLL